MGERNARLLNLLSGGDNEQKIARRNGMSLNELAAFKTRHAVELVKRRLRNSA